MEHHFKERVIAAIPLKKIGQPEDVANLHLFLADDEAAYISGEIIYVEAASKSGSFHLTKRQAHCKWC